MQLKKEERMPSLEGRGDAILISDNSILFELPSAHGIYAQLCAGLVEGDWPYLIVPIASTLPLSSGAAAVGKFPDTIKAILEKYNVPFATP